MNAWARWWDDRLDWFLENALLPLTALLILVGIAGLCVLIFAGESIPECQPGHVASKVQSQETTYVLVGQVMVPTRVTVGRWVCVEDRR